MVLAPLLLGLALAQDPETATYTDRSLGLAFQHPKPWTVRKEQFYTVFEWPIGEGRTANAQVFSAVYRQSAETWQAIQAEVNKAMNRTVDRQWQEEILGVPLLLTRISYTEEGKSLVTVVGLVYSATPQKMQYRLTAPAEGADQAIADWSTVMLSLRTTGGNLPSAEDPSKPPPPPPEEVKPVTVLKPDGTPVGNLRGPVTATFEGSTVYLPEGWKLEEGGALVHGSLRGGLTLRVTVGSDADARKALGTASATSLPSFRQVTLRRDRIESANRAGALVSGVLRIGEASGAQAIGHWVGSCAGKFWSVEYVARERSDADADRRLLDGLLDILYVGVAG
jgi:hypothetical protein